MAEESSEKVPIALAGPEDVERSLPPAYSAVSLKPPSSTGRLLRIGAVVLVTGAVLLLFGAIGAFYFWKIYNVHYTMSINGKVQEGSMEIDAGNSLETFKTGSGSEEAIEVHDFQIGITGIRFAGGEKCYIKAQAKAHIPDVDAMTKESLSFDLEDEIMPVKFDENSLIWVAADQPVKDNSFLSPKILDLCKDLPVFWLRPSYPKGSQREKREAKRKVRQVQSNFDMDQFEAAAEEVNTRPRSNQRVQESERQSNDTGPSEQDTSSSFNPDNPYHVSITLARRICEPLMGYYPWPYNYQGCRSACRIIMPCSWWVARILGIV
uniref:Leukocyte cell-derived chemotaxin 1 n=1 Tax=Sphenodon punctatus TaxID=8508 RepID=A0A8D0GSB3_SPHPU